ncbi:MAG TPA: IS110 family transposase [Bryobacteraceae bacterium]|jgi:transposase|nr:IS110 family transposase [Bryobacteraceae bacterium]
MQQFIGCDAHKKFSVFVAVNEKGHAGEALRVTHDRQVYREFLGQLPAHSEIAIEASGSYNWLVDEMERSGHHPRLCNPLESKRRMGLTNKTDKLDAKGLAILLRNGTLPEVWIPPSELRDQRELLRLRIFLVRLRTRVKNRIHGTLSRHNVLVPGADLFGVGPRLQLTARLPELPEHSREAVEQELATLDFLNTQIESAERRLEAIMKVSVEADLLKTLPCVGKILSMVLMLEIGKVERFPTAAHLASYAGLVPRVYSSGGHTRMGQVCGNVNRNLKWAFVETGNLIAISQRRLAGTHVVRLYQRVKRAKNHQKAATAVARHLAEAAWWVLSKQEGYREPNGSRQGLSSTHG